jgi:dipeptidyl aminopeptidase/acylaminoacyl peptidase
MKRSRIPETRPLALSILCLGLPALAGPASAGAQQALATYEPAAAQAFEFDLSIRSIMRGPEIVGQAPTGVAWSDDSEWIYFSWKPAGAAWHESRDLYRVSTDGGEPELVPEARADSIRGVLTGGAVSADRRLRVTSWGGDLFLVDRRSGEVRRLLRTSASESRPRFGAGDDRVLFRSGNNGFALDLATGAVTQLTDIRSGPEPGDDPEAEGQRAFLEEQQRELFEHVRVDELRQEERDSTEARRDRRALQPVYLDRDERVQGLVSSPGGDWVTVEASLPASDARGTMVPDWVTGSGYTEELNVRSKVGDEQSSSRLGLIDVATGQATWLDLLPADYREGLGETDDPDYADITIHGWNDAGTHALITAVSFDYKTRWIYTLEAATAELTLLEAWFDEAWVGGPCFNGCAGWIPGTDRAFYSSEATGFAHLYAAEADGSNPAVLTEGEWEVHRVAIPESRDHFLVHASPESPFEWNAYRMEFDGSGWEAVTVGAGQSNATPSPDGDRMAVIHSRANRPAELFVGEYDDGASLEQLTVSPSAEWLTFPWVQPGIVRFDAEDGASVPARIYRPSDMGVEPNGAAVIFVHGAGYLHNVHNWWSSYYREYMFHHFLAAQGYTVLDVDYRGSAGYGRDWRTGIYRWMGGKDLSDQVDGARYLVADEGIDPNRIGIYGGSYGGFITLMALFTADDTFRSGAALRSVTDWAHYNHWYTSRILNLPQDDEEAYRQSSPIYFAENLRPDQHLLILHGMVDTNVHYSDVVRLAQRLIELGKENWEMALYPVEGHGFAEPSSWTDEYRRIYKLFRETIGPDAIR